MLKYEILLSTYQKKKKSHSAINGLAIFAQNHECSIPLNFKVHNWTLKVTYYTNQP